MHAPELRQIGAWLLPLALLACNADAPVVVEDAGTAKARETAEHAFAMKQQHWRDQRLQELTKPDGWTSLVGLHWIEPGPHYVGRARDNGIRLAVGPAQLGMLDLKKDGRLRLVPARGAGLTLNGKLLTGARQLRSDADPEGADQIGFDAGQGGASVIKRGDRYALRVRHADAPTRTGFVGLDYWPAKSNWQVEGRFITHPPGKTIAIVNILSMLENTPNPGVVEFSRNGRQYRLEALDGGDGALFFVFADRSNGRGSYSAGRFLDAAPADAQGRVVLDFNQAYNPPCAFTLFATCPLPPPENRLDLLIEAGEKSYAKPLAVN